MNRGIANSTPGKPRLVPAFVLFTEALALLSASAGSRKQTTATARRRLQSCIGMFPTLKYIPRVDFVPNGPVFCDLAEGYPLSEEW